MDYLKELLPDITYDGATIKNLFVKYNFRTAIKDEYLAVYNITHESLEEISYLLYGDTIYWWVIALINDIDDVIFDMPLSHESLQNMATDIATVNGVFSLGAYTTAYDALEIENDIKRKIKVIKPDLLNTFIAELVKLYQDSQST